MYTEYTSKDVERFWAKVDKSDHPQGCWVWTATKNNQGYGKLGWGQKNAGANRVSYLITYGAFPDDLCVLHHCDNPACVRPDHLFLGTHHDNMVDMVQKGRYRKSQRLPKPRNPNARRDAAATLTEAQVIEIRRLFAAGGITRHALAVQFKVWDVTIGDIIRRKTWRSVP